MELNRAALSEQARRRAKHVSDQNGLENLAHNTILDSSRSRELRILCRKQGARSPSQADVRIECFVQYYLQGSQFPMRINAICTI